MSAPRIKVHSDSCDAWFLCTGCGFWHQSHPEAPDWSLAEAADAGLAHLAAYHTAPMPHAAHGDPDGAKVSQNLAVQVRNAYSAALDTAYNEGARR